MRFEYGLGGVMAALVIGILTMIALGPDEIAVPRAQPEPERITPVPVPEFEDMPETVVEEAKPLEEPVVPPSQQKDVQDIGVQEEINAELAPRETQPQEPMEGLSSPEVKIAFGSSLPGCEETNECYIPALVEISIGKTVTWVNDDTAAHTVTSGTVEGGPDGVFDSGLFLAGKTFEYTFGEAGEYPYFCMVHPWMTGIVKVLE